MTLEVTALVADTGLRAPSVYQLFELRSEDIGHLLYVSINPSAPGDLDL